MKTSETGRLSFLPFERRNIVKVRAIWEFDADVSDISPEHVDIEGLAKDLAKNELNVLMCDFDISAEDFDYEVVQN